MAEGGMNTVLSEREWLEGVEQPCDGSCDCQAVRHIHGCFADAGSCDHPDEYHGPLASRSVPGIGEAE